MYWSVGHKGKDGVRDEGGRNERKRMREVKGRKELNQRYLREEKCKKTGNEGRRKGKKQTMKGRKE